MDDVSKPKNLRRVAVTMNGISIGYVLALVNSAMAIVNSFGINLDGTQRAAIVVFVNTALALAIHLSHRVGEVAAAGGTGDLSRAQTAEIMAEATPNGP